MRFQFLQVVSVIILIVLLQGSAGNPDSSYLPADTTYFPDTGWTATTPEAQGMNSTILDDMMQFIEDSDAPIKGLVVTRNGYIVKEEYWMYNTEISTHHIFSCTKSFTGALIGIALKEGFIDNVSQKVIDFFPDLTIENMDTRKEAITLEHLLTMTAGLDWDEWNTTYDDSNNMYHQMLGSTDPVQFFLDLPTAYDPGTHWVYCTGGSHMLSAIIQETTNMTTREFAEEYLFEPLNMTIGGWTPDLLGINNGGSNLYVTLRTMAKLGLLYLNNGTWDGQEIIPAEYVIQSYYPHVSLEFEDYGYQWWIDSDIGVFNARGTEGQYIHVAPEFNIVISITQHADEYGEDINRDILEYVLASILEEETVTDTVDLLLPIIGVSAVILVAVAVIYVRKS